MMRYTHACLWSAEWNGIPAAICCAQCCHFSFQGKSIIAIVVTHWPFSCVLIAHGSIEEERWRATFSCSSRKGNLKVYHMYFIKTCKVFQTDSTVHSSPINNKVFRQISYTLLWQSHISQSSGRNDNMKQAEQTAGCYFCSLHALVVL